MLASQGSIPCGVGISKTMRHLKQYIARLNRRKEPFDLTCPKERRWLFNELQNDLSPENLCCDGEISVSEARSKEQFLLAVEDELLQIDPSLKTTTS